MVDTRLIAALVLLLLAACPQPEPEPDPEPEPEDVPRALLLDEELAHHSGWIDVIDAFDSAGLAVDYRRFFPHLTDADVVQTDDAASYDLIVMAAGRWPGTPASRARADEIELAVSFVEQGGTLVLVPQSGWRDSWTGENDWFVHNRILEELGVDVRIDRNVVVGQLWSGDPSPPHEPEVQGYPTPLEFTLGYPYVLAADNARVAAGNSPTLRVDDPDIQLLLRTYVVGYLWQALEGAGSVDVLDDALAMATLTPVGDGWVAVIPRGPLTVAATSGLLSDKPALDLPQRQLNRDFVFATVAQLVDLARGEVEFEVTRSRDGDDLFSVAADGFDPLDDEDVWEIASPVSQLDLPAAPPPGDLLEVAPPPLTDPYPRPDWFGADGVGSLAYGSLPPDQATMPDGLSELVAHDVDVLMTSTDPSRLATLTGDDLAAEQAMYVQLAADATAAGARWYVGDWYNATPGDYPEMVGAHGGAGGVVAPLSEGYWSEVMIPMYAATGEMAAEAPGLAGIHVDLELYSGPVTHHDGWAFSDDTLEAGLALMADAGLADDLRDAAPQDRLDLLVDGGALGDYLAALEEAAAELGRRCREAAHASAPDLQLTLYTAGYPNTWFYKGLLRGMGTPDRPSVMLTYEGWADRTTETLQAEGIDFVHLGGTIVSHWLPGDFEESLYALGAGNDGYWYFTWNDFSVTNPDPPAMHGSQAEYWDAVDAANARLAE